MGAGLQRPGGRDGDQILIAAEVTNNTADFGKFEPMVTAAIAELAWAGVTDTPGVAVADAGYWNEEQIDEVVADKHIPVLIPPDAGNRTSPRPGWTGGRFTAMRYVLASEAGRDIYRKRKQMIEPVFGHTKHNRGARRFHRRGRTAVRTEWAVTDGNSQPVEAPPPRDRRCRGLRAPAGVTRPISHAIVTNFGDQQGRAL